MDAPVYVGYPLNSLHHYIYSSLPMAAFVAHNMPQNHPGTLTPQQAYDVSAFIHTMPRPKFNKEYKHY